MADDDRRGSRRAQPDAVCLQRRRSRRHILLTDTRRHSPDATGSRDHSRNQSGLYRSAHGGLHGGQQLHALRQRLRHHVAAHPFGEFYLTRHLSTALSCARGETLTIGIAAPVVQGRRLPPSPTPLAHNRRRIPSVSATSAHSASLTSACSPRPRACAHHRQGGIVKCSRSAGTTAHASAPAEHGGTAPAGIYIVRFGAATAKVLVR
jgi:hypothetical protein